MSSARILGKIGKVGIWTKEQAAAERPDMMYQFFDLVELWQSNPEWVKSMLTELLTMLGDKTIEPLNFTVFSLAKSEDAFRFMARAMHIGKVVITLPRSSPWRSRRRGATS